MLLICCQYLICSWYSYCLLPLLHLAKTVFWLSLHCLSDCLWSLVFRPHLSGSSPEFAVICLWHLNVIWSQCCPHLWPENIIPDFAYSCSYPVIWTSSLSAVRCDLMWPDLAHGCASIQLFLYMRHCQTWELISEVEQQPLAQTLLLFLHPTSSWSVCAIFSIQPHECILAEMFCNSSAAFLQALFTIPPDQQQRHPCFFLQSLWTVGPASTHLDPSTPKQLAVGPAHHHKPTLPFIPHFVIHIVFRALSFLIPISFLCLCIWNGESRGIKKKKRMRGCKLCILELQGHGDSLYQEEFLGSMHLHSDLGDWGVCPKMRVSGLCTLSWSSAMGLCSLHFHLLQFPPQCSVQVFTVLTFFFYYYF